MSSFAERFGELTVGQILEMNSAAEKYCINKKRRNEMTGTRMGGLSAATTNKRKHGEDFYQRIGRKGGQRGHTGGFYANHDLARRAGRKGGRISRRGPAKNKEVYATI